MLKYLLAIFIVLFLIGGCSDEAVLSKMPADAVILAFGDSLTHGNGAKPEESYPAVLAELSGRQVINAGNSGEESAAGLARLPALLDLHRPKLMILCHGGNDFLRKKDMGKLETNIRAMISLAKSKDIEVILLGVPKPGLFLSSAEVYGKIADSEGIVFVEDLVADVLGDNSLKSDTVHPNKAGYRIMAENIYETLKEAGAL
ncbi:MAG: acyl-CoA thioesterase-1 [Planctomycetota bacterium]|jgi:acyl-CoA thioesterase-1